MLWRRLSKNGGLVPAGPVAGFALMLLFGCARNGGEARKEMLQRNTFGDLQIITEPFTERSDTKDVMIISKGDVPVLILYNSDSNEVDRFAVTNGMNGMVVTGRLTKSGISEFVLYGNAVHEGLRMPVFTVDASDKPSVWTKVRYTPSVAAVYDKGKMVSYRVEGEVYHDIDFDGQFDAKSIYDKDSDGESVVSSESIFIDGQWLELVHREPDGQWKRKGLCEEDKSRAYTVEGEKTVYFDFVWGKGWHRRPEREVQEDSRMARR